MINFSRWPTKQSSTCDIFDSDGTIHYEEPRQGRAGTCYVMQAMGGIGEFPELVRDIFLTKTKNDVGIHGLQLYIRGKKWHISIDDYLVYYYNSIYYAKASRDGNAIWGALLEKAWAKARGNYMSANGGFIATGVRAFTGVPVFRYKASSYNTTEELAQLHDMMKRYDDLGFISGLSTSGSGDAYKNECGIAMSHAYSLLAAFNMTDASGVVHRMLMIRNPWGTNNYNETWNYRDSSWTDALKAQVPFNFDPTQQNSYTGIFLAPIEILKLGWCFNSIEFGHMRDSSGYDNTWYDEIGAPEYSMLSYEFLPTRQDGDIYFAVESYPYKFVPAECFTG